MANTVKALHHRARIMLTGNAYLMKLSRRFASHDNSKLQPIEAEYLGQYKEFEYEGDYDPKKAHPAVVHHFENNSHHPEHYPNGINGMNLLDLSEMLIDWEADAKAEGIPIVEFFKQKIKKFNINGQLEDIIINSIPNFIHD